MEQSSGRKHDVHAMPPQAICNLYKKYQRADNASIDADLNIVDFRRGLTPEQEKSIVLVDTVSSEIIVEAEKAFRSTNGEDPGDTKASPPSCTIYEHKDFPGIQPHFVAAACKAPT
jgi:alkylated DNA repair protein alkB family protein 1